MCNEIIPVSFKFIHFFVQHSSNIGNIVFKTASAIKLDVLKTPVITVIGSIA